MEVLFNQTDDGSVILVIVSIVLVLQAIYYINLIYVLQDYFRTLKNGVYHIINYFSFSIFLYV